MLNAEIFKVEFSSTVKKITIDGRSVNENALFVKGKCTTAVALDGKNIQPRKTLDFCVSVCSPLVERQNLKSIFKGVKRK